MRLPCIICEKGDIQSNIVCQTCEDKIELRRDTFEYMFELAKEMNDIQGPIDDEMINKLKYEVTEVYELLCKIRI
jgi:hypothetical protein